MPTEKKIREVEELTEVLSRSTVVIGADYRGLRVDETTALRRQLREAGVEMHVIKNTLFLRAADAAGKPELGELAEGPTALIIGFDDPIAPVKTVVEYQRAARNTFAARKAYLDGQIIAGSRLSELASLPPRDMMIAEFAGVIQSPITTFVYLIQATVQEFYGLVEARLDQMGGVPAEAEAPAAEDEAPAAEAATDGPPAEQEASAEPEASAAPEASAEAEAPTEPDAAPEAEAAEAEAESTETETTEEAT